MVRLAQQRLCERPCEPAGRSFASTQAQGPAIAIQWIETFYRPPAEDFASSIRACQRSCNSLQLILFLPTCPVSSMWIICRGFHFFAIRFGVPECDAQPMGS